MLLDIFKNNENKSNEIVQTTGLSKDDINQVVNMTLDNIKEYFYQKEEQDRQRHEENRKAWNANHKNLVVVDNRMKNFESQIKSIKGEFFEGKEENSLKDAIELKAKQIIDKKGFQMTIDSFVKENTLDTFQRSAIEEKINTQYRSDLGKYKNKILKSTLKYAGYKGNSSYKHIKKRDLDRMLKYIKNLRASDINI
ncbi:hypothetical protein K4Q79_10585 [Staphylococcus epidermidis]|nr:hypothetical protein [Staphylococcus epidermidis]